MWFPVSPVRRPQGSQSPYMCAGRMRFRTSMCKSSLNLPFPSGAGPLLSSRTQSSFLHRFLSPPSLTSHYCVPLVIPNPSLGSDIYHYTPAIMPCLSLTALSPSYKLAFPVQQEVYPATPPRLLSKPCWESRVSVRLTSPSNADSADTSPFPLHSTLGL